MLFHTSTFFIFFVSFLLAYKSLPSMRNKIYCILVFSNIFYGWWSWKFLLLLWLTIVVDFYISKRISRLEKKSARLGLLLFSISINIGILFFFKYYNFFIDSVSILGTGNLADWSLPNLVLPVGISFYIFQSLSYSIDVYRRRFQPVDSIIDYAAFVCYFPQLVAGPIERLDNLLPQLLKPRKLTYSIFVSGFFLFCFGFLRKSFADTLATMIDPVFANVLTSTPTTVLLAVFGFGLQIYLDFTGYVDMARGISRIIGVELSINFDAPYTSSSPREFWRRWHISLSGWLRDYLYISLGGNRYGLPRHVFALMLTMILGGLWHGAGANFLIWGFLHGLYLVAFLFIDRLVTHVRVESKISPIVNMILVSFGLISTYIAVNYAWIYFRCQDFTCAKNVNIKLLELFSAPGQFVYYKMIVAMIVLVIGFEIMLRFKPQWLQVTYNETSEDFSLLLIILASLMFTLGFILLAGIPTQQFLYFQF